MNPLKIQELLTPYNRTVSPTPERIKYIVIHYVGAIGGAKANCKYYASKYIGASAHYYVGFEGEIWQSVMDKDIAWHCGAKKYIHCECRNINSIGIEMCVKNKGSLADTSQDWYFEDATVESTIKLTRELMKKYQISADHVIRHYDVTGKICPNPYVYNHTKHTWDAFKAAIYEGDKHSAGWTKDNTGWWYCHLDGSYTTNDWEQIAGKWYWFDGAGYAVQNAWKKTDMKWYYLGDDCSMVYGLHVIKGKVYYFGQDGAMATDPVTLIPNRDGVLGDA